MGFQLFTKKGYSLFEVSSALQKDIRRSNEQPALYWAFELVQSNFAAYLWKRLLVISMEDIGPANHAAPAQILAFGAAYEQLRRKKSKETNLAVASAVVYLVRCEKSRLYDWAKCLMVDTHPSARLPIPSYAVDMHTTRGRREGKGIEDFFSDGCKVHPHRPVTMEMEYMEQARALYCSATTSIPGSDVANTSNLGGDSMTQGEQFEFPGS